MTMTVLGTGSSSTILARLSTVDKRPGLCAVGLSPPLGRSDPVLTTTSHIHLEHPQVHPERRVPAAYSEFGHPQPRQHAPVLRQLRPGQRDWWRQQDTEPDSQDPRRFQGL
jgi:hypothetical protein